MFLYKCKTLLISLNFIPQILMGSSRYQRMTVQFSDLEFLVIGNFLLNIQYNCIFLDRQSVSLYFYQTNLLVNWWQVKLGNTFWILIGKFKKSRLLENTWGWAKVVKQNLSIYKKIYSEHSQSWKLWCRVVKGMG